MKKCCCNCEGMAFWDGDYVCTMEMMIHQYGYRFPTVPGAKYGAEQGVWMDEDFEKTIKTPETCEYYSYTQHHEYLEKEFMKWLKYKKMIKEYEAKMRG